jgi:periplasmic protein TonB
MTGICHNRRLNEYEIGQSGDVPPGQVSSDRPGLRQSKSEVPMGETIEIHEPEVKEKRPEIRPGAAVLPQRGVVQPAFVPRPMFADSVLEFGVQRKRKAFATSVSFLLNFLAIGGLLLVPLLFTEELPKAQLLTFLVAPPPPPPPPPPAAEQVVKVVRQIQSDLLSSGALRTPARIPEKVQMIKEEDAPPPMPVASGGVIGGVPGGVPGGQMGGVIGGIISATSKLTAVPKFIPATPQRVRISQGVTKGLLIHRVEPPYPPLAKAARVQGDVLLKAIINRDGDIQDLQLISGHPMLVPGAIAAVKQWRYKPYLLNGQPVEVETTVTVIFTLSN